MNADDNILIRNSILSTTTTTVTVITTVTTTTPTNLFSFSLTRALAHLEVCAQSCGARPEVRRRPLPTAAKTIPPIATTRTFCPKTTTTTTSTPVAAATAATNAAEANTRITWPTMTPPLSIPPVVRRFYFSSSSSTFNGSPRPFV